MKIDILVPLAGHGGVENVIDRTAVFLTDRGYDVRIVQMVYDGISWVTSEVPFYALRSEKVGHISEFIDMYDDFVSKTYRPDLVLASPWPYLSEVAAKVRERSLKPFKIVSWLHAPIETYEQYGCGGLDCIAMADGVFVLNERSSRLVQTSIPGVSVNVVRNPVDFDAESVIGSDVSHKSLLFVGRLSEEKRVDRIVKAISQTSDWQLTLVGDGDQADSLRQQVAQLGLMDRVHFLGWQNKPWEVCGDTSALALTSDYEAFPLAIVEALSRGIPVFSTPVDGAAELIKNGENGYLVRDEEQLAELLCEYGSDVYPKISIEGCLQSVESFKAEAALEDFEQKLAGVLDKISIIVPCYNVEDKVSRCIESVLAQTITGVKLELILVDDKSADGTLAVLEKYEQKYPELIMLIPLEENGRQGRARNIALMYATGDYVTYLDSDDYWDERILERLYQGIKLTGADVSECGYEMIIGDKTLNVSSAEETVIFDFEDQHDKKTYLIRRAWKTAPWGRLYRKAFLVDNNITFAESVIMEDIQFSYKALMHMKSCVLMPAPYYKYVINSESTMSTVSNMNYMDEARVQNSVIDEVLSSSRFDDVLEELEYAYFGKAFAGPLWRMFEDEKLFSYQNYCELRDGVIKRFPEISGNPYINASTEKEKVLARSLITQPIYSEEQLYRLMNYSHED